MDRREWLRTALLAAPALFYNPMHLFARHPQAPYTRADFGPAFRWGVATAAYQIEGAHDANGKGPSVWDTFSHRKGKIKTGENGDRACEFYRRYADDIALMASMGIPDFRFSLSWSRIFPEGKGKPNPAGLDFYKRVLDECEKQGITPWVTLYHWDLPQALEDQGGWPNRDVLGWFADYSDHCTRVLGDRVKHWMVLNEPAAFTGLGYMLGMHAPGRRSVGKYFATVHHACMAQAEGGRIIRANVPGAEIGTTFSASHIEAKRDRPRDRRAAEKVDAMLNRLFIEPALGMGYPIEAFPPLRRVEKHIRPGDMEKLVFDFDFIGLQNYTREVVRHALFPPVVWAKMIKPQKRGVEPEAITEMNWEVYPEGIYHLLRKFAAYPGVKKIIVTENGAAFPDRREEGAVHDSRRTAFIREYLGEVLRARRDGVPVEGYFVWTFMDNFEWAEGYKPRFGLVYVDFETQERIVKDSGKWYADFLKGK